MKSQAKTESEVIQAEHNHVYWRDKYVCKEKRASQPA